MDTLSTATQLDEEIQYPDGCNAIIIEGTGDEPFTEVLPLLSDLTLSPNPFITYGRENPAGYLKCTVTVNDPNNTSLGSPKVMKEVVSIAQNDEQDTLEVKLSLSMLPDTKTWTLFNPTVPTSCTINWSNPQEDIDRWNAYQAWCASQPYGIWDFISGNEEDGYVYGRQRKVARLRSDGYDVVDYRTFVLVTDSDGDFRNVQKICHYNGIYTLTWEKISGVDINGDGEILGNEEVDGVTSGFFYENTNPSTRAQTEFAIYKDGSSLKSTAYFCSPSSSGLCTIQANYSGVWIYGRVNAIPGWMGNAKLTLEADPSSIGLGQESVIRASLFDASGTIPVNGQTINFNPSMGKMRSYSCVTEGVLGFEEDSQITSSVVDEQTNLKRWSFSLSRPIVHLDPSNIVVNPNVAIDQNYALRTITESDYTISGSTVTFNSGFKIPNESYELDSYPIMVTYDWGGYAHGYYIGTELTPSEGAMVIGSVKGLPDISGSCFVTVTAESSNNLDFTAEPTTLDKSDSTDPAAVKQSTLTLVYRRPTFELDEYGFQTTTKKNRQYWDGGSGSVRLSIARGSGTCPSSIPLRTKEFTNTIMQVQGQRTVTTPYPISEVYSVKFPAYPLGLGSDYYSPGGSFEGSTITLGRTLPSNISEATVCVSYKAEGLGEGIFYSAAIDEYVYLVASIESDTKSCELIVGNPSGIYPTEVDFTEVNPEPVRAGGISHITFTMRTEDGDPVPDYTNVATVVLKGTGNFGYIYSGHLELIDLPKNPITGVVVGETTRDITCSSTVGQVIGGVGRITYYAPTGFSGEIVLEAYHKDNNLLGDADPYHTPAKASRSIKIGLAVAEYTEIRHPGGTISVKYDPRNGYFSYDPPSMTVDLGAASAMYLDGSGMASSTVDPTLYPMKIRCLGKSSLSSPGITLFGKKISGGSAYLNSDDIGTNHILNISIPWESESNKKEYYVNVASATNQTPIAYASVTIKTISGATYTELTDKDGKATFRDLPVGTHDIYISAQNYRSNRAPLVGGSGPGYDVDSYNDQITITAPPPNPWVLEPMNITINVEYIYTKVTYKTVVPETS